MIQFPTEVEQFDADPRISFSKLSDRWLLETESGQEYEYIASFKRWAPVVDEGLVKEQQEAYGSSEPAAQDSNDLSDEQSRFPAKRKQGEDSSSGAKTKRQKQSKKPHAERKNTAVYVTKLPSSVSVAELSSVFSRCGVIAEEIDSGKPRIKLYNDEHGVFKGEALVVYFREESVGLAVQMMDDTDFRFGEPGMSGGKMRVQAADFSYKREKDVPTVGGPEAAAVTGIESRKSEAEKQKMRDREKVKKKTQKLNDKLADWDDDDPSAMPQISSRWDKVVILKHMFTLDELAEDPASILDIKEDIRDECSKLGNVTNVVLFDAEPDGVVSVRFDSEGAARACVRLMDGRFFGGTKCEAYVADGNEKFKKNLAEGAVGGEDLGEIGEGHGDEEQ